MFPLRSFSLLTLAGGILMLFASLLAMGRSSAHGDGMAMDTTRRDTALMAVLNGVKELETKMGTDSLMGHVTDTAGVALPGVVVSDGFTCTRTDSMGRYALPRHRDSRFVYYTVPDYCEVPVHADNDRTACFYEAVTDTDSVYNFTLTRLPNGPEKQYRLIVIGDPQVTNARNPYYTAPDDNRIDKTDLQRFTEETMADIRRTIEKLPEGTPVYGLSMGDDVQYYGGYNDTLELGIRHALGSSQMRLFSVIGNHDQDGKRVYREKWEESFGPTDYSFDRGDVHFVCFNNCDFYHGGLYYSPGELSDAQMAWLTQDLALADKRKKVVLNYHIPLTFGNNPRKHAVPLDLPSEPGHYASSRLAQLLTLLDRFEGGYELFCGHTHFALNHEIDFEGRHLLEHCHAAACGTIWQSNINICGTPNGYYVYSFDGTSMADAHYKGTGWSAARQMTLFRADTMFNEESYAADWDLPRKRGTIVANVFNADSRWRVVAMENGLEHDMTRISSTGQDAFATGYHHKYAEAMNYWFISKRNGYLIMNHLYYYVPRSPRSTIFIKAIDPYGNTYTTTSTEVEKRPFMNYAHYY